MRGTRPLLRRKILKFLASLPIRFALRTDCRRRMPPRRTSPRARARPEASSSVSASTSTTACATTTAEPSCSPPPLIRANSAPAELQLPSDQQPGQPALGCIKRRYTFFVGLAVGVLAPVSIWRAELSAGVSLGVGHVANYTNLSVGDSLNYLNYEQVVAGTSPSPDPSLGPSPSPSPSLSPSPSPKLDPLTWGRRWCG